MCWFKTQAALLLLGCVTYVTSLTGDNVCTFATSETVTRVGNQRSNQVVRYKPDCGWWRRTFTPSECTTRYSTSYSLRTVTVYKTVYKTKAKCCPGWQERNGTCTQSCPPGTYGESCQRNCSCPANAFCDPETGDCSCLDGWIGDQCENKCPAGFFGANCSSSCLCKNGALCDHREGSCTCTAGWNGTVCDQACHSGSYGIACNQSCNCGGRECDPVTGTCLCEVGRTGNSCEKECPQGSYGLKCKNKCTCIMENTKHCSSVNGTCTCKEEWAGEACTDSLDPAERRSKTKDSSLSDGDIAAIALTVIFSTVTMIAVIVIIVICRRRKAKKSDSEKSTMQMSALPADFDVDGDPRYADPDEPPNSMSNDHAIRQSKKRLVPADYEYVATSKTKPGQKQTSRNVGNNNMDEINIENPEYFKMRTSLIKGSENGAISSANLPPSNTEFAEYAEIKDSDVKNSSLVRPDQGLNNMNIYSDINEPGPSVPQDYGKLDHSGQKFTKRVVPENPYSHIGDSVDPLEDQHGNKSENSNKYDVLDHKGTGKRQKVISAGSGSEYESLDLKPREGFSSTVV